MVLPEDIIEYSICGYLSIYDLYPLRRTSPAFTQAYRRRVRDLLNTESPSYTPDGEW